MKYVYPAIFTPSEEDGFLVNFPDLESCYTNGEDMKDAFINAEDVLNLILWNMEESKKDIPTPSSPKAVSYDENSFVSLVSADTLTYRKLHDTKAVKKTLSIPRWLDTMAQDKNVNFSNVLQNALIEELGVMPSSKAMTKLL